ncbi:MAG: metallophosphoesterase family protein [Cytophagales bacterium]|nr:metallophosphoesterase family protein [Armatimonadota bacterium]
MGALLAFAPLLAQETKSAALKVADSVVHRPTAIPDRIILTFAGDPARSQAVSWRTDNTVAPGEAVAQIAPASAYPKFGEKAVSTTALSAPVETDLGTAHYHSANFAGLNPSTLYAYRVGDGTNWSEWIHFKTASEKPEAFSFIYFGDAQNDIKSLWSRAIRAAYSDAPKARFMIHAGDLINRAGNDGEWGEWFGAGGWMNGMIPSIPTPGNHEYGGKQLDNHWRPQFALPTNGPAGLEETCYYVDYQGVRIVSLNTEEKQQEQVAWLDDVLSKNPHRWTVLTFHRPMFSSAKGRDNKELRALWMPLFDRHRVDLVLQGHDHTYARSKNLRAGVNVRDGESGTVYVVSVSGPKMYNLERSPWMQRAAEDTQLYQVISVEKDTLRYEARTVTGELYDAFDLKKQKGGANRLTERAPKTTERLRANDSVTVP